MNHALAPPRNDRNPVGLAVVVGLHLLLAGAMLTARLSTARLAAAPPPLANIEQPPREPPRPHDLPDPPKTLLHPFVVPVPEVVVERMEPTIPAASPAPAAAPASPVPAPAKEGPVVTDAMRAAAHGVRVDAGNKQCRPVYPHVAEREGVTGITKVRITIDATGHVSGAQLLEPSGKLRENRNMDQAAIEALSSCPATAGADETGRPVGGAIDINYKWSIL